LGQLVIVSNRVAIPEKNAMARAGGLEVAVKLVFGSAIIVLDVNARDYNNRKD